MSYLGKRIEDTYQKKDLRQQMLDSPDTWAGSIAPQEEEMWVVDEEDDGVIVREAVKSIEAFYKIYDEILVNAIDQYQRIETKMAEAPAAEFKPVRKISVTLDPASGWITVENDGEGLDVVLHAVLGKYVPEVVFGILLTSANYDKTEKRTVGGKNGFGAKITNVFSKEFKVETVDWRRRLRYRQTWRNNMTVVETPVIDTYRKVPYTRISYLPDYERFGVPPEAISTMGDWQLLRRRVYDIAACTGREVLVYLNGRKLGVKGFEDYINLYIGKKSETKRVYLEAGPRWQLAVCLSQDGEFQQVSFVNGLFTDREGSHVTHVMTNLVKRIIERVDAASKKKVDLKPAFIKNNLRLFLRSTIENPSFDTQTKRKLISTVDSFGSRCELTDEFVDGIIKLGILKRAEQLAEFKAKAGLDKKMSGSARTKRIFHPKLVEGSGVGPNRKGHLATIVFTEGDSAAGFMAKGLKGIPESEHQYWGYFPLRGKILNIRTATLKQLEKNEEIAMIIKILGLQPGRAYTDTRDLRYDRVMLLTDADKDGFHIKGLLMNLFSKKWPSLLNLEGFLCDMATPINRALPKAAGTAAGILEFYTEREYRLWVETVGAELLRRYRIKYYKGLGSWEPKEAREICKAMKTTNYYRQPEMITVPALKGGTLRTLDNTDYHFELVFEKNYEDRRKAWLNDGYVPGTEPPAGATASQIKRMNYVYFLNNYVKQFSAADNVRSIPNLMDGLKPSQRKILYCAFKRGDLSGRHANQEGLKVAQLAGYVSEHGAYHHAEESLTGTIVNMAQDYVGHGNYGLFYPSGNFGSRRGGGTDLKKGDDSAAPRYIFTYLNRATEQLFRETDSPLLTQQEDEGQPIEPVFFLPVIPFVLVNGAAGIGTGYSTTIPAYNPFTIIRNVRHYLAGEPYEPMAPWYRGYRGRITMLDENRFQTAGAWCRLDADTIRVTELPVGTNTCKSFLAYQAFLNTLLPEELRKVATMAGASTGGRKKKTAGDSEPTPAVEGSEDSGAFKGPVLRDYVMVTFTDTEFVVDLQFVPGLLDRELGAWPASPDIYSETGIRLAKKLKLAYTFTTNNLHLYDIDGIIKRFSSPLAILDHWAQIRYNYYVARHQHLLDQYNEALAKAAARYRFVVEVMDEKLDFKRQSRRAAEQILANCQPPYPKFKPAGGKRATATEEEGESEDTGSYHYLLSLQISSFTAEKLEKLQREQDHWSELLAKLQANTPADLWLEDLATLETALHEEFTDWAARNSLGPVNTGGPKLKLTVKAS
jgi:DNA topoisomerase-2